MSILSNCEYLIEAFSYQYCADLGLKGNQLQPYDFLYAGYDTYFQVTKYQGQRSLI